VKSFDPGVPSPVEQHPLDGIAGVIRGTLSSTVLRFPTREPNTTPLFAANGWNDPDYDPAFRLFRTVFDLFGGHGDCSLLLI
jgi:hypothetical protein